MKTICPMCGKSHTLLSTQIALVKITALYACTKCNSVYHLCNHVVEDNPFEVESKQNSSIDAPEVQHKSLLKKLIGTKK